MIDTCACESCEEILFNVIYNEHGEFYLECYNCGERTHLKDIPSWRGDLN